MILIDTGYLLAFLDNRDALHVRATARASKLTERMLVSEYVLVETFNACSRPINRPKVHALLAHLRASGEYEIVPASADLFEPGTRLHRQRSDKERSLTECNSFHLMQSRTLARALSHDEHFTQAGFDALLRSDP